MSILQSLPKPASPVSLPPLSSLLADVDVQAPKHALATHDTLLSHHFSGHSVPLMIPQQLPPIHHSYSHYPVTSHDISRSSSASSLSPAFDHGSTLASLSSNQLQPQGQPQHHPVPPLEPHPEPHSKEPFKTIHDSSKPRKYQCKTCDKSFTTSGHLARHARIHTGERKHVCPHSGCEARFARQDNCMQHFRTHTAKKTRKVRRKA